MRKQIVAGNWKMNNDSKETKTLLEALKQHDCPSDVSVMVAPTFVNLQSSVNHLSNSPVEVVAQNMHQAKNGAFTGEVSAQMLQSVGIKTVILGHSERRAYFNETNALLKEKVITALDNGMQVIFCFGEELSDRQTSNHFNVVEQQLKESLFNLSAQEWSQIILAYEPVWAIGTGETASPEQAQEMHAFIRTVIAQQYPETAETVSILYGGSVKPANAKSIFSKPDVDGGLIGGASLNADDFFGIVTAF